jgi:hypothetical protein
MVHQGLKSLVLSTWQRPQIFDHFLFFTIPYYQLQFLIRSVQFVLDTNWPQPAFEMREVSLCKFLRIKKKLVAGRRIELPTLGL